MDIERLCGLFQNSLEPDLRKSAEEELDKVFKIIEFSPSLLKIVTNDQVQQPVRQAAAIYFKNMVTNYWEDKERTKPTDPIEFSIHENDRNFIRGVIVEAIARTPKLLRIQLSAAFQYICKTDFPNKWPQLAEQTVAKLNSQTLEDFSGGLTVLYQISKVYTYKKADECSARDEIMKIVFPHIYERCIQILPDPSEPSVEMQKMILKVFHCVTQYFYPLGLLSCEAFQPWFVLCQNIVEREIPAHVNELDDDEKSISVWWKCKKWASRIMQRIFERFGSPGNVVSETYDNFATWFLKTLSVPGMITSLSVLNNMRLKVYVAPRVLQNCIQYLTQCINHGHCWTKMKSQMQSLIQELIYPLLCFSEEDHELWQDDPVEFIRSKFDIFEEFYSPVNAAETLLILSCNKRKEVLPHTLQFAVGILTAQGTSPQNREGALRLIGSLSDVLLKKKIYKSQVETMLQSQVIPELTSPHGFMRSRACWTINQFASVKLRDPATLVAMTQGVINCVLSEEELPVKVNAAMALHQVLGAQEKSLELVRPVVAKILETVLMMIRQTVNDELNAVIQRLISDFEDEIATYAVQIAQHLAETFKVVIERDDDENVEDRAMTAMGLLNTIESMVNVLEENREIMSQLEPVVLSIVGYVLQNNSQEFYEEILSIVDSLTMTAVSESMWQVFDYLFTMFSQDGYDYFLDFLPPLHNYIVIDTPAFVTDLTRAERVICMCKTVLTNEEANEDFEIHAAKLLEVLIIQCGPAVDALLPAIVQLALDRLTKEVKCSELRTMCIQIGVAALYKNPGLLLQILEGMKLPNSQESITHHFINQWITDTDCFFGLHDRKLCVLGLCSLLESSVASQRLEVINGAMQQLLPSFLLLFQGLRRAYHYKAQAEEGGDDDEDSSDEDGSDIEEIDDDDDTINEDETDYLMSLAKRTGDVVDLEAGDLDDDDDDEIDEETNLEAYTTLLDEDDCDVDEFMVFKNMLTSIRDGNPMLFAKLTGHLSDEQRKEIEEIFVSADQRLAVREAKKIEKAGGYQFQQTSVPSTFNFSPERKPIQFGGANPAGSGDRS